MDAKDQRLEIRLPQQQLEELDSIRQSVDSPYTPTRSDVVRMFITQGIERINGPREKSPKELTLGERLGLFFQIEHLDFFRRANDPSARHPSYNYPGKIPKPSNDEVIKQIYLHRCLWFFELDSASLKLIDNTLSGNAIASLMDKTPNKETTQSLAYVAEVVRMFHDIANCITNHNNSHESIELIQKLSKRDNIPLRFNGFPNEMKMFNEMAALISWIDGQSSYFSTTSNPNDETEKYKSMLNVYKDAKKGEYQLSLKSAQEMMLDKRLT